MKTRTATKTSEISIFGRILHSGNLPPASARFFLSLDFSAEDKARMDDLADRNQEGALTAQEHAELAGFSRAACLLGVLHSRARKALKAAKKVYLS